MTQTVVLAMGLAAYTCESVALDDALESLTLGCTDDINERDAFADNIGEGHGVAEIKFPCEIGLKLDQFALGSGSCLFEMPLKRRAGVFFCGFVIGKLYSGITIFFDCTDLRNNTRPSFDDGAWNIFSISTENGSHSDFLSN